MAAALGDTSGKDTRPLPPWDDPDAATSAWRYLDLSGTVASLVYGEQKQAAQPDMGATFDTNRDGKITLAEIEASAGVGVRVRRAEVSTGRTGHGSGEDRRRTKSKGIRSA